MIAVHKLMDILVIAICAIICGADNWVAVESFGQRSIIGYLDSYNYPTDFL